jgi:hypothetical protein
MMKSLSVLGLLAGLAACGAASDDPTEPDAGAGDGDAAETAPDAAPDAAPDPGALAFAEGSVDLGAALVGEAGAVTELRLANHGESPVTGLVLGVGAGDVALDGHTCGTTIAAGGDCTVRVHLTPTAAGARTATLTASSADPAISATVTLTGTGLTPGALAIAPASIELARTRIGAAPSVYTVTVRNTGTAALPALTATTGDGSDFSIASSSCGAGLAGGGSCEIVVGFRPTVGGVRRGALAVSAGMAGTTVALTGRGYGIVELRKTGDGAATATITGGGLDCGATCRVEVEASRVELDVAVDPRYGRVMTWSNGCAGNQCSVSIEAGETIVTTQVRRVFAASFTQTGSGTGQVAVSGASCEALGSNARYCLAGTTATLVATPAGATADTRHRFGGWTGCDQVSGPQNETCTIVVDRDRAPVGTFVRQFLVGTNLSECAANALTCAIVEQNGPTDAINTLVQRPSRFVDQDTTIRLRAVENIDQNTSFMAWEGECFGQGADCTHTVRRPIVMAARFRREYRLTVRANRATDSTNSRITVSNPAGNCDLETCEYRYPSPVNVTLTGVSRGACGIFTGLSGDCSGTAACTIRMDRRRIVTGNFRPSNSCGGVPDAR